MNDEDRLNSMIHLSSNVDLKKPTFKDWFTRGHQKIYTFNLAAKIFTENDMSAEEAIKDAQEFIDTFYTMVVDKDTRG